MQKDPYPRHFCGNEGLCILYQINQIYQIYNHQSADLMGL